MKKRSLAIPFLSSLLPPAGGREEGRGNMDPLRNCLFIFGVLPRDNLFCLYYLSIMPRTANRERFADRQAALDY